MEIETRQESSIPVQARISLIDLAELAVMWEENGCVVRTMSQLVAMSLGLLCAELKRSDKIKPVESVRDGHAILNSRGLYQNSLRNRAEKKINMALGFESLRQDGIDPRGYAPAYYKNLHNKHSVDGDVPVVEKNKDSYVSPYEEEWKKIKLAKQQEMHEEKKRIKEETENASKRLAITDDEASKLKEIYDREQEEVKRLVRESKERNNEDKE